MKKWKRLSIFMMIALLVVFIFCFSQKTLNMDALPFTGSETTLPHTYTSATTFGLAEVGTFMALIGGGFFGFYKYLDAKMSEREKIYVAKVEELEKKIDELTELLYQERTEKVRLEEQLRRI